MKKVVEFKSFVSLTKIIEASKAYCQKQDLELTKAHYELFIEALPENLQSYFINKGFKKTCTTYVFRRFVLEISGNSMYSYLAEYLTAEELEIWEAQDQFFRKLLTSVN